MSTDWHLQSHILAVGHCSLSPNLSPSFKNQEYQQLFGLIEDYIKHPKRMKRQGSPS